MAARRADARAAVGVDGSAGRVFATGDEHGRAIGATVAAVAAVVLAARAAHVPDALARLEKWPLRDEGRGAASWPGRVDLPYLAAAGACFGLWTIAIAWPLDVPPALGVVG
jgi:hypothetical protein